MRDGLRHRLAAALVQPLALVALAALAWVGWVVRVEIVIIFAGILFGVTAYAGARWLVHRTPLPHWASVGVVYGGALLLLAGFFVFTGQRLSSQYGELGERIPSALETVEERVEGLPVLGPVGRRLGDLTRQMNGGRSDGASGGSGEEGSQGSGTSGEAAGGSQEGGGGEGGQGGMDAGATALDVARVTLGSLGNVGFVLLLALYVALDGHRYTEAILRLVPEERRPIAEDLSSALGTALPWWVVGRLASMAVVAALTIPGLLLLGIPLAFVLGLIAGLFSFVPILGPLASVVPALLVTLEAVPGKVPWVLALYAGVQLVESWIVTPRIQDRVSETPPLLLLSAQLVAGVLVGIAGIMFSTPMALAALVVVQVLYLKHTLGQDSKIVGQGPG
jgi:predicted PurR-regulated permease PerM